MYMESLEQVSKERSELYQCRLTEGLQSPLLVRPADIEDDLPTEAKIAVSVQGLKGGRSGGPSGMQAEDLKE